MTTPLELTESLLAFCKSHHYAAPVLQMTALDSCRTALSEGDIDAACRYAKEVVVGPIPWREQFDSNRPEPLGNESAAYANAVFYALLMLWKQQMIELSPPLCNCCHLPKTLNWQCERVLHK